MAGRRWPRFRRRSRWNSQTRGCRCCGCRCGKASRRINATTSRTSVCGACRRSPARLPGDHPDRTRGFGDHKLFAYLADLGFAYVIRFRAATSASPTPPTRRGPRAMGRQIRPGAQAARRPHHRVARLSGRADACRRDRTGDVRIRTPPGACGPSPLRALRCDPAISVATGPSSCSNRHKVDLATNPETLRNRTHDAGKQFPCD
ncbi:MAG: hypothetical protein QOF90_166 [Acetobacteraceae bacterium]|nr:hypothetical protein [Acetobacteraceae bacterium]